ncbi:hypothetical protein BUALT_Bualt02G0008800 [Buddleja alternifolia]|uniref:asparagine--tRNA ligase n=1 Tax=Buddleja alternifolia TaxID=168488 RepID=A0AAV6XY08_9LAMI|nr:hypothetical protein BUALT_Bualt02G0008800 [Buddleja alternifolia]
MASEQDHVEAPLALSKYSKRAILETLLSRPDGGTGLIGQRTVIGGWVKSSREFRKEVPQSVEAPPPAVEVGEHKDATCMEILQSKLPFFRSILKAFGGEHRIREKLDAILPKPPQPSISILQVSDGSCVPSLQVLVDSALASPSQVMPTGTCILVEGILQKPSLQGKETIELKTEKILHIGTVDQDRYPLSKKRLPLELLRDSTHFRPRTTTVASVMRIRNTLNQATYTFFQQNGFLHVQVPIITTVDSEGHGEIFHVTTLLGKHNAEDQNPTHEGIKIEDIKASIKETESKSKDHAAESKVNLSEDYFNCETNLTNSGRLHLESYACALGNVYAYGPRFEAKRFESKKMLAEMWTVEIEMAFSHLEDSMECASDFLKFMCKWVLENCDEDLKFVSKRVDRLVVDRLQLIASGSFEKISYTEAVQVLKQVTERNFEAKVEWGVPLNEEHESYLTDEIYKKSLIIYDHPKELKPFHVRLNDDGKTVATFDVIIPKVGTIIRGSQNEERFNLLSARIKELGLEKKQYEWYLDLRKHGAVKCSGFSFLFDPLVLYATGLNDVRDAVPFPRSFGKANN